MDDNTAQANNKAMMRRREKHEHSAVAGTAQENVGINYIINWCKESSLCPETPCKGAHDASIPYTPTKAAAPADDLPLPVRDSA